MGEKAIELKNITFSFEDYVVFTDANLQIKAGTFVALIGANGAGKTTLFNLILGNYKNYKGTIELYGKDIKITKNISCISYIAQNIVALYKDFPTTIEELLKIHLKVMKSKKTVEEILGLVNMELHRKKTLIELSGGQLQRVALAVALLKETKLIILDEPTSGVDKDFTDSFFKILKELTKSGKTILMSTHNLRNALKYIDKVVKIEEHKILELSNEEIRKELIYTHDYKNNN